MNINILNKNLNLIRDFMKSKGQDVRFKILSDRFEVMYQDKIKAFGIPNASDGYDVLDTLEEVCEFIGCVLFDKDIFTGCEKKHNFILFWDGRFNMKIVQLYYINKVDMPYMQENDAYLRDWWLFNSDEFFESLSDCHKNFSIFVYKGKEFYIMPKIEPIEFVYLNSCECEELLKYNSYYRDFDYGIYIMLKNDIYLDTKILTEQLQNENLALNFLGFIDGFCKKLSACASLEDLEELKNNLFNAFVEHVKTPYNLMAHLSDMLDKCAGITRVKDKKYDYPVYNFKGLFDIHLKEL